MKPTFRVLYFGDIYARPGRKALEVAIPKIRSEIDIDFVIVNGENAAHGRGVTNSIFREFMDLGIDVVTTGNHAWDQGDIFRIMEETHQIIRPANYPPMNPGLGWTVVESKKNPDLQLAVVQLMGRVHMDALDCPFQGLDRVLAEIKAEYSDIPIFVDFHAEATSEKEAFTYYAAGRVAAVVGSHYHVQTADERQLPEGTAAITDVGMTGCYDSVIGAKKEIVIQKFLNKRPAKLEPAEGTPGYGCVWIEIDSLTGKALRIERIRVSQI
jgi:2',3'-cyclic-nucleotide 2'-phosphodiesterase